MHAAQEGAAGSWYGAELAVTIHKRSPSLGISTKLGHQDQQTCDAEIGHKA